VPPMIEAGGSSYRVMAVFSGRTYSHQVPTLGELPVFCP